MKFAVVHIFLWFKIFKTTLVLIFLWLVLIIIMIWNKLKLMGEFYIKLGFEPQDVPNLAKRLLLSHKYGYLKFTSSGKFISCNSCSDVAQYVFKNMRLFQKCLQVHGLTSHCFHPTISINLKLFNNLWLPDECTLC